MLRALFYAIPIVLAIFAIVDCVQTPDEEVRGLPRIAWLVIILFFPIVGPAAWLIAGRAAGGAGRPRVPWPSGPGTSQPDPQRAEPERGLSAEPAEAADAAGVERAAEVAVRRFQFAAIEADLSDAAQ